MQQHSSKQHMILKGFLRHYYIFSIIIESLALNIDSSHGSMDNLYLEVERILFLRVNTTFHAVHKTCNKITDASPKETLQEAIS